MTPSKTALVTGAASGIGRAITEYLLDKGYGVIGLVRDASKVTGLKKNFRPHVVNLADIDGLAAKLNAVIEDHPVIDAIIACAGAGRFGSIEEFSSKQIRELIDLNLVSQIEMVRVLLPKMKRHKHGDIIFIGSDAALQGGRKGSVYAASKFGLRGFAQSLRQECAASGLRVSLVNPGMVKTNFFDQLNFAPGPDEENYIRPKDVAKAVNMILELPPGTVVDEINLSPLKKVIKFRPQDKLAKRK